MERPGIQNTTEVDDSPSPRPQHDKEDTWLQYFGTQDALVDCGCQIGRELGSYKTVIDLNTLMLYIFLTNYFY